MIDNIFKFLNSVNGVLWNYILLVGLIGLGLYLTIILKFPQFTRVFPQLKAMLKDIKSGKTVEKGKMTPFQA